MLSAERLPIGISIAVVRLRFRNNPWVDRSCTSGRFGRLREGTVRCTTWRSGKASVVEVGDVRRVNSAPADPWQEAWPTLEQEMCPQLESRNGDSVAGGTAPACKAIRW